MPTLPEILSDREKYADTLTMRIGDTEVPLSSLRQLNASEQESLKTAISSAQAKEQEVNRRHEEVVGLSKKAQEAYEAAQQLQQTAQRQQNPPADPFADPWLSPVKTEFANRDKTIDELKAMLKTYGTVITNAATIFSEDRLDNEYGRLDFGKREKRPSRDELRDYALKNKIVDRHGLPSVARAWEDMSKGEREADLKKQEFERGMELGRQQALASRLPAPGVPGAPPAMASKEIISSGSINSGALYEEALKDPELNALISQLPPGLM